MLRYSNVDDHSPISWPIPIGKTPTTFAIRVKMSYDFWTWFKKVGFRNLNELNAKNNWNIRLIQEKSLTNKDRENLCLYVRNKIREMYRSRGMQPIHMKVKKDHLQLENVGTFDPVILAKRLHISFEGWHGLSINSLIDEKILKEGGLNHVGDLVLPGLEEKGNEAAISTRKRPMEESSEQSNPVKQSRNLDDERNK